MHTLALLLALVTQFKIVAKGPDGKLTEYEPGQNIPVAGYVCKTSVERDGEHGLVAVTCSEKDKEVVSATAICYTNQPDKNVAAFKFANTFFMLGCRTVPGPEIL